MKKVTVNLAERTYDIVIEAGLIKNITKYLSSMEIGGKVFIITDQNVAKLYLEDVNKAILDCSTKVHNIILAPGEQLKSFVNLTKVANEILKNNPDRNSTIIALGGGVIGDLSGFVASIMLRGINFIQIPTTFLAQVDSSVGGKTGINTNYGKNLIGSFYQPKLVLIDPNTLLSLSDREYYSGYVEALKYGLIDMADFFTFLDKNKENIKNKDIHTLSKIISTCCNAKARIVAEDEKEKGKRALLNLGHTFAHSLEKETNYSELLKHGEAVALGIILALKFSIKLGFCIESDLKKVSSHFEYLNIKTDLAQIKFSWNKENIIKNMYSDKKTINNHLVFILLNGIGKSFISRNIKDNLLSEFFNEIL